MLERILIVLAVTCGAYLLTLLLGVVLDRISRRRREQEEALYSVHPQIRAWLREEVESFVTEKHPAESATPRQLHTHLEKLRENLLVAIDAELERPMVAALDQRRRAWSGGKPTGAEQLVAEPLLPQLQSLGPVSDDIQPDAAQIAVLQQWLDQAARRAGVNAPTNRPVTISMQ